MTKTIQTTFRLLNQTYTIKCPEEETKTLDQAMAILNKQLQDKKKQFQGLDDNKLLFLAALQISHELIKEKSKQVEQNQQLSQFINLLEERFSLTEK